MWLCVHTKCRESRFVRGNAVLHVSPVVFTLHHDVDAEIELPDNLRLLTALTTLSLELPGNISMDTAIQPLPLNASGLKNLVFINKPHNGLPDQMIRQFHHLNQLTGVILALLRFTSFSCLLRSVYHASFLLLRIPDTESVMKRLEWAGGSMMKFCSPSKWQMAGPNFRSIVTPSNQKHVGLQLLIQVSPGCKQSRSQGLQSI